MKKYDVVIVGAGFTGLAAAFELTKKGKRVHVIESEKSVGGLAGTFEFEDGVTVEKFYHHWFNNDTYIPTLVNDLGLKGDIILLPTRTGMYFNGRMWKLSSPLDLLRFKALSLLDRFRLGLLVFQVRQIKDWKSIEHLSIREWLEPLCGKSVYKTVWEPLITAKFSIFAEKINAVWMWKKLVLRGSTRNEKGGEELAYFKGGFGRLAEKMVDAIIENGGTVSTGTTVQRINVAGEMIHSLETDKGNYEAENYLFTPAFPIIANIMKDVEDQEWIKSLKRVKYLGNMCLVLRLKFSLSETYWINVNDPGFPFVGVIEHTNFDSPNNYKDSHIAYLSRYLSVEDPSWSYSDEDYFNFAMEHLKRMFPKLESSWILGYKVWRSAHAQPVTEKDYSNYLPSKKTPFKNGFISTMAQIYPQDRGTNYAIRDGRDAFNLIYEN